MPQEQNFGLMERPERRAQRESALRVWDRLVRVGHWLMVVFFAIIYLRYRKFPIHAYAGYLILVVVIVRIAWGLVGSRAARFKAFWFTPGEAWDYARKAVQGHAAYYVSHNPMGSWMVYSLLALILLNGVLGLMLYSAGQQLGPLGSQVPDDWEDLLILTHSVLGHITAAFVAIHLAGVLWAVRVHRENYVMAMITGMKRAPRDADPDQFAGYRRVPENVIPAPLRPIERWFSYRHPFMGSILLVIAILLVVLELTEAAASLNKHLPSY